jgi:hypothetical protein
MESLQAKAIIKVLEVLDKLGIIYVVGGSFASSLYGNARLTNDIDIVVAINLNHAENLVKELEDEFYIDEESIKRAIRSAKTFNAIHFESSFKVDFFVAQGGGLQEKELERRQLHTMNTVPKITFYAATPEDIILAKLDWYYKGGGVSTQQWSDIAGVIKVQHERLDFEYLKSWAQKLGVGDWLTRAIEEAIGE